MELCRKTWISKAIRCLSIFILIPGSVGLFAVGCYFLVIFIIELPYTWAGVLWSIILLLASILILSFGIKEYSFEARKYSITEKGLHLNGKNNPFFPWNQLYGIGIYPFDAAVSLEVYDQVICCFLAPVPDNFKNNIFRNTLFFAQRNQDKFVVIDYDEAIIKALSAVYQKDIIDHTEDMDGHIRNM